MNRFASFILIALASFCLPSCAASGSTANHFDQGLIFIVVGNIHSTESGCTNGTGYMECSMAAGAQMSESDLQISNPLTGSPEPYASGSGCATSLTSANFRIFETATGDGVPYTVEMRPSGCRFVVSPDYVPDTKNTRDAFIASIK
jgi:hypothetical protein